LDRIEKVREKFGANEIDGLVSFKRENIRYLTGFSGSTAAVVLTRDKAFFLTDFRYTTQAKDEVNGDFEIRECKKIIESLSELIKSLGLRTIGFESHLSYAIYQELQDKLNPPMLVSTKNLIEDIRIVKEPAEVKCIREAIGVAGRAFKKIRGVIKQGCKERDVAIEMEYLLRKEGTEAIPFDIIVASGERGAMPHGIAGDKVIKDGELVIVDFGSRHKGYHSDCTRTLAIGGFDKRQREIYEIALSAQREAVKAIKPGEKASEIDSKARGYIKDAGYGNNFGHSTGHGVGLEVHENPRIAEEQDDIIKEGMVFTVEPGIYIPGWGGIRIEDMIVVTNDGCEVLTSAIEKEFY
jgi:Xaa-Pro aminopeptidase